MLSINIHMSLWYVSTRTGHCARIDITQDTEFPGVVARPIGSFKTSSDYHYQTMRCNVDLLKIIQVGLTLADEEGNYPQDVTTWQFNFSFSVKCVYRLTSSSNTIQFLVVMICMPRNRSNSCRNQGSTFRDTRRLAYHLTILRSS